MPIALCERNPRVTAEEVLAGLCPPPTFADSTFANYRPVPGQPSQQRALDSVSSFARSLSAATPDERLRLRRWSRRRASPEPASGLYLDGGFGVGKTHLLAALWHCVPGPKLFATFVELTHLAGALGFAEAVERLSSYRLVCIDEFELDDPGDTVLMSTLLSRLIERGVSLAATSNTLPDRLGEGRFAAEDFLREIQALSSRFRVVRIDGPDYRHRELTSPAKPHDDAALLALAGSRPDASFDHFVDLCRHLEELHPSTYGALVESVGLVCLQEVRQLHDQATALRLVVFTDRLYDRGAAVAASGLALDRVFSDEMLSGGFRKKYYRAFSRLAALSHALPAT
ncbi:MAG: cell division protein ZapE [Nocardioidaceae bacterium]|nr:cell division protein ZapE [Nocardioidaceae bacterium]